MTADHIAHLATLSLLLTIWRTYRWEKRETALRQRLSA